MCIVWKVILRYTNHSDLDEVFFYIKREGIFENAFTFDVKKLI